MKNVFLEAMNEPFDLTEMMVKIDYHHIRGNLTDDEREELVSYAREKANPYDGVDVLDKLEEIEKRLRVLEEGEWESNETETVLEYQDGKWYYAGDKITFNGKTYVCIAPAGVVCVWNPNDYPAYWEEV